ncbi:MAG: AsmA-like C-terminal region-containing protein, partial [Cytophagaceae bacterium]
NVLIKEAYKTFNTVQKLASAAENMEGRMSTDMKFSGLLGQDMSPVMNTLNGAGVIRIDDAKLHGNKMMKGISKLTNIKELDPVEMKNVQVKFQLVNGNVKIEPFDLRPGNAVMNIGGEQSLEGVINYAVKMDIPAGAVGAQVNNAISKITGAPSDGSQNIKLDLGVTGTTTDPKVALLGNTKEQAKDAVKNRVESAVKDKINENESVIKAREEKERLEREAEAKKREVEERRKAEEERLRREAEERKRAEEERLKREAEEKARKEAEKVIPTDKIKVPKF